MAFYPQKKDKVGGPPKKISKGGGGPHVWIKRMFIYINNNFKKVDKLRGGWGGVWQSGCTFL